VAISLKPQDVYVVLKIVAAGSGRSPYAQRAVELHRRLGQIHG
jgi:hypothetical protein